MKEAVRHEREIGVVVDIAAAAECILAARESQSEGERESDTQGERSDNDFLLHRIWMCPTSVQIDIKLRAHARARQECSHVSPSGRQAAHPSARLGQEG